jgi:hypothetical protein
MTKSSQRVQIRARTQNDVTPTSTIATIRTTTRHVFLSPKVRDAIATRTGAHVYVRFIKKSAVSGYVRTHPSTSQFNHPNCAHHLDVLEPRYTHRVQKLD